MDNLSILDSKVGYIPSVFCSNGACQTSIPLTGNGVMNLRDGIPSDYSNDVKSGGKLIDRSMLNTIGRLGTRAQFFEQCGGYYTFDPEVSAAIGGYPLNAILHYYAEGDGIFHKVRSLRGGNTFDFTKYGVDGINWAYCDATVESISPVFPDFENGIDVTNDLFNNLVTVESIYGNTFQNLNDGMCSRYAMNEFTMPIDGYLSYAFLGCKLDYEENSDGTWGDGRDGSGAVYLSICGNGSSVYSDFSNSPIVNYFANILPYSWGATRYSYQGLTTGGGIIPLSIGDKVKIRRFFVPSAKYDTFLDGETIGGRFDFCYNQFSAFVYGKRRI